MSYLTLHGDQCSKLLFHWTHSYKVCDKYMYEDKAKSPKLPLSSFVMEGMNQVIAHFNLLPFLVDNWHGQCNSVRDIQQVESEGSFNNLKAQMLCAIYRLTCQKAAAILPVPGLCLKCFTLDQNCVPLFLLGHSCVASFCEIRAGYIS